MRFRCRNRSTISLQSRSDYCARAPHGGIVAVLQRGRATWKRPRPWHRSVDPRCEANPTRVPRTSHGVPSACPHERREHEVRQQPAASTRWSLRTSSRRRSSNIWTTRVVVSAWTWEGGNCAPAPGDRRVATVAGIRFNGGAGQYRTTSDLVREVVVEYLRWAGHLERTRLTATTSPQNLSSGGREAVAAVVVKWVGESLLSVSAWIVKRSSPAGSSVRRPVPVGWA